MEKLYINLNDRLTQMEKYRLTVEELLVVELLFLASVEENHSEFLKRYYSMNVTKTGLRDVLLSLQAKGVILKSYKVPESGKPFNPQSVQFNQLFLNNYRKFSGELGVEFFQEYPSIAIINGVEAPLKNFAKKFNTEEEFYYAYGKAIGWKEDTHKRVMDIIKWGRDNGCRLMNMNIADFVISKMWNSVEELKNGNGVMTFDSTTSI